MRGGEEGERDFKEHEIEDKSPVRNEHLIENEGDQEKAEEREKGTHKDLLTRSALVKFEMSVSRWSRMMWRS